MVACGPSLQGQCVLNTRPLHQQSELNKRLQDDGAEVLNLPAIEIVATEESAFLLSLAQNIEHYHIALFVSRNAVDGAFRYLSNKQLPSDLQLGVIGEASFQALHDLVGDRDRRLIRSHPFNSEGLLAAPELQQVDGRNIIIFRGQQGRNLLGDELKKRGATISYCEVYRRQQPAFDITQFKKNYSQLPPTVAVFTSTEGMNNVLELLDRESRQKLSNTPWLLISERMRESAVKLGHNATIIIAKNARDEGIHQALSEWAGQQPI